MAEVIVSTIVKQLTEITRKQIEEEVNLVRGVKKEVMYLSDELKAIRNVLDDAERRGYKEKTIQDWLKELEDISYDIADVLDEWNYVKLKLQIEGPDSVVVPPKVCPFILSCLSVEKIATRHDIAKKIKKLKERMDMTVKKKARYDFIVAQPVEPRTSDRRITTSFVEVSEIQGRAADKDALVSNLILEGASKEESRHRVISIVGTGGIGKTTLAQLVYNDKLVTNFFEKTIWICVSDVPDEIKIAKGIIEQVNGSAPNLNELESLLKCVANSISGQKFLLVLDDVWEEYYSKWEPLENSLKYGGLGSKILVTTRSKMVAKKMGTIENETHYLGLLSDIDCWFLMRRIAFLGRSPEDCEKLQDIGRNMANKCKGLPLAAKVLGSLLHFKDNVEEWENVLNSEIWKLEKVEVELFPHLYLSYNELSPAMKHCFSYCAIFPKDYEIDVEQLIRMWMAQGYLGSDGSANDLEFRGKEYISNLRMRSLLEETHNSLKCKMHDIIHDFAQFLRQNKSHKIKHLDGRVKATTKELSHTCDPSLVSHIKVYHSLICEDVLPFSHLIRGLRVLKVSKWEKIKTEIENLIHLRYLDLSECAWLGQVPQTMLKLYNLETLYLSECELKEIPKEIGYLIHLRHLDLSSNSKIKELPETIYNLHRLHTLNLTECISLERIPEGIHRLVDLIHFHNSNTSSLRQIPQGLEQLTSLRTLNLYYVGRGWSKLGYLNKLDKLNGDLSLFIRLHDAEDVIEAQKAELRNKIGIQTLSLFFSDFIERTNEGESVRNDVMKALQAPPNLTRLGIDGYKGTKFPVWITSSLNHLRSLEIEDCEFCSVVPAFGKLPCLENLSIRSMDKLQFLGREFLGIASSEDINARLPSPSSPVVTGFPNLKELIIFLWPNWNEWEDITPEEEGSAIVSIMPCLEKLAISCCDLTVLPHRLLRKASSLQHLDITSSPHLSERYKDKEGSDWISLSHIPHVKVDGWDL